MSIRTLGVVAAVLFALGCSKSTDGTTGGSSGGSTGGSSGSSSSGPCHAPAETPSCTSAPAHLSDAPLNQNFLADVFQQVGISGALGRRVTFGDVDGDHFPDFIAIQTGVTPGLQHLYMNRPNPDGGRMFVETTQESGILQSENPDAGEQVALMVAFADVDNDGDLDLFEGSYSQAPSGSKFVWQPNELYLNDGTGHFTLDTNAHVNQPWPLTTVAAVFTDFDRDGKLDLFVGNFMIDYGATSGPDAYPTGYQDLLFRGDGTGGFTNVTDSAGLTTPDPLGASSGNFAKATYGATACDYDNDGLPDILTSNYALEADDLWRNHGDGTFNDVGMSVGYAWDNDSYPGELPWRQGGNSFAAACGDYDNDGDLDVYVASTTHQEGAIGGGQFDDRVYADRSALLVNGGPDAGYAFSRPDHYTVYPDGGGYWDKPVTGINRIIDSYDANDPMAEFGDEGDHGVTWADLDNDGLLDLIIEQSAYEKSHAWIFHQKPDHTFENVTALSGQQDEMLNSNGLSVDDYNRDGKLDILMGSVAANGVNPPGGIEQVHLYENQVNNGNHWLHVTLHGVTANRQGIGAKVWATAGCLTQMREISGGKGTFGAADPAYAHFGLGTQTVVDKLVIQWPTNPPKVQTLTNVAVDQFLEVTEDSDTLSCEPAAQ